MLNYATLESVKQHLQKLIRENGSLKPTDGLVFVREIESYIEIIKFYADHKNWTPQETGQFDEIATDYEIKEDGTKIPITEKYPVIAESAISQDQGDKAYQFLKRRELIK